MPDDAPTPREEDHKPPPTGAAQPAPTEQAAADGVSPDAASEAKPIARCGRRFPGSVFHDSHGQPVVYVERDAWHDVAAFLRDEEKFTQCLDVTVVDHLLDEQRLGGPRRGARALRGRGQLPLAPAQPAHPVDLRGPADDTTLAASPTSTPA